MKIKLFYVGCLDCLRPLLLESSISRPDSTVYRGRCTGCSQPYEIILSRRPVLAVPKHKPRIPKGLRRQ